MNGVETGQNGEQSPEEKKEATIEGVISVLLNSLKENREELLPDLSEEEFQDLLGGIEVVESTFDNLSGALGAVYGILLQCGIEDPEAFLIEKGILAKDEN